MSRKFGVLVTLVLAFALTGLADEKKAEKEVTVKGEVVDVSCYLAHGARGDGHKTCAEACAKAGGALGILTSAGKLYVSLMPDNHSTGPNAMLMDHIAQTVEAKGFLRSKGGVEGIMISSVAAEK
jgi:hypothetical protein